MPDALCEYRDGGLYVPGLDCWLDAGTPRRQGFISHAHTDHYAAHRKILCTQATAELLPLVKPYEEELPPCRPLPVGRPFETRGGRVTLFPSGHILGAAMLRLERDGQTLLYSGDVRPAGSLTAPPGEVVPADHLIVEDTFGDMHQPFVTPRGGAARVVEFCRQSLARGDAPVLVTTSGCGKAQDMVLALADAGLSTALQPKIWHFTRVFARLGIPVRGFTKLVGGGPPGADVVIANQTYLQYNDLSAWLPNARYALVSGWAASAETEGYDAAIPWSDHASREELLAFIEAVNPQTVWTFAGSGRLAEEIASPTRQTRHLPTL